MSGFCTLCRRYLSGQATSKIKRFYKNVSISNPDNAHFNVCLDQRNLKTPGGRRLDLRNEALAVAIGNEWLSQKQFIEPSSMHFTSLVNTCIDNPLYLKSEDVIDRLVSQLEHDTVLWFEPDSDNPQLLRMQQQSLLPIIQWANSELDTQLAPCQGICSEGVSEQDKAAFADYLSRFSFETLIGLQFAADSIKSVLLTLAAFRNNLDCESAVALSRMEEQFQISQWGSVEWAHEMNRLDTTSRFCASVLFATYSSESHLKSSTQRARRS